jgi:hypothetical protein
MRLLDAGARKWFPFFEFRRRGSFGKSINVIGGGDTGSTRFLARLCNQRDGRAPDPQDRSN